MHHITWRLIENMPTIIIECQTGTKGVRMRFAWGRRREAPGRPAPPLPEDIPKAKDDRKPTDYLLYEEFNTPEEAAAAKVIRDRGKDVPPPPLASDSAE